MGRGYIHPVAFAVMQSQRRAQASFAERLYVTEGVSAEELRDMRTGQMSALCKKLDAREPDRTYTMADMLKAYDAGFNSTREGWNGEYPSMENILDKPEVEEFKEYFTRRAAALAVI